MEKTLTPSARASKPRLNVTVALLAVLLIILGTALVLSLPEGVFPARPELMACAVIISCCIILKYYSNVKI